MSTIRLAVSIGDYNGIGPEIIIKAFADPEIRQHCDFTIWGTKSIFSEIFSMLSPGLRKEYKSGFDFVLDNLCCNDEIESVNLTDFSPGTPTRRSGRAAYFFLAHAIQSWKNGTCDGIVTAPVMKKTFFPKDYPFNGQTEWIAHEVGSEQSLMVMVTGSLRIALVTTHIAICDIPEKMTRQAILDKGKILHKSLIGDLGIAEPEIAVCALNPHAGESGRFGIEEKIIIEPALEELRKSGGVWHGPLPADTLFTRKKVRKYDGFLAMYHDQGLIPAKVYSGMHGINFTAGLPLVRTSPDHGTAMDIAGKGIADERSMKEAIKLAAQVAQRRAATG